MHKSCSSIDSSFRGNNIIRRCSEEGDWEEINYSACTIESESSTFLLLWIVIEASSGDEQQIEANRETLENEVRCCTLLLHVLESHAYTCIL